MITLDRHTAPEIKTVSDFTIKRAESTTLSNGLQLHTISAGEQEVLKIEWYFNAGSWNEDKFLEAVTTNKLLKEGTALKTSEEFASLIDFYGATIRTNFNDDFGFITLYCLNKHLENILPLVAEMLTQPRFDENELNIFIQNRIDKLKVNNTKNDYVSRNTIDEVLFGKHHPYGLYPSSEMYKAITRDDLVNFHKKRYALNTCHIIASGKVPTNFESLINQHFNVTQEGGITTNKEHRIQPISSKKIIKSLPYSHQAGVAMGKPFVQKGHKDFSALIVANTILGGYFGSRLMSNIREDKGYTYGIYSSLIPNIRAGYSTISAEVGRNVWQDALKEIKIEIERLCNDKVGESELNLVRNYLLGNFLSSIDGPFSLANRLKGTLFHGLDYSYYDTFVETIKTVDSTTLLDLYQQHFNLDDYVEVAVI